MLRVLLLLLLTAFALTAANFKLYLKDGGFHIVREYKVEGDRVSYYSVERSEWEEMPLALVDITKTEAVNAERNAGIAEKAKQAAEEDAAAKEIRDQIRKIPQDPGVYMLSEKNELRIFKLADSTLHTDKGRKALKIITGIPLIPGKATLEIPGEHSENVIAESRPEFYMQLSQQRRYGIVRIHSGKNVRIVEKVSTLEITKESAEEREDIEIFTKQLTDNLLFKIWPQEPLEKGEYAVIEFDEGKVNPQIWDFRIQ